MVKKKYFKNVAVCEPKTDAVILDGLAKSMWEKPFKSIEPEKQKWLKEKVLEESKAVFYG